MLHCFRSPLFFLNFRSTHLEIKSLLFLSNTTHSDQTHKYNQIKPIQKKKKKKKLKQPRLTVMRQNTIRERRLLEWVMVFQTQLLAFSATRASGKAVIDRSYSLGIWFLRRKAMVLRIESC